MSSPCEPTISVAIFTHAGDQYMMVNCLRSLAELEPDQVCILNTTRDEAASLRFSDWLYGYGHDELGLRVYISCKKWAGNFAQARNDVLAMCECDWTLMLDADEMLTLEAARDLRGKLRSLPDHALALRMSKLELLDDEHCLSRGVWKSATQRPPRGAHPQVVKTGRGKCMGSGVHEIYVYPGRTEIPWDSPDHPKKDWHFYYLLHLWLYKDNPLRKWPDEKWRTKQEEGATELWRARTDEIIKERGWKKIEIPPGIATWAPIVWTD